MPRTLASVEREPEAREEDAMEEELGKEDTESREGGG
jgi:hypothetical protein